VTTFRRISTKSLGAGTIALAAVTVLPAAANALLPDRHQYWRQNTNPGATSSECANVGVVHPGPGTHGSTSSYAVAKANCAAGDGGFADALLNQGGSPLYASDASVRSQAERTPPAGGGDVGASCSLDRYSRNGGASDDRSHDMECVSRYN
jgi:hypothetical protein